MAGEKIIVKAYVYEHAEPVEVELMDKALRADFATRMKSAYLSELFATKAVFEPEDDRD